MLAGSSRFGFVGALEPTLGTGATSWGGGGGDFHDSHSWDRMVGWLSSFLDMARLGFVADRVVLVAARKGVR